MKHPDDLRQSPKKEHHIASGPARRPFLGAVHEFLCGCCAEPTSQSRYIDVTRASCPGFPSAHDVSGLSAPTPNLYVCASIRTVQTHTIIIVSGPSCGSLTLIYSWTVQLTPTPRRTGSARLVLNTCRVFQRGCSRRNSLSSVRVL